ncbi:hypothetical protein PpBr36_03189 [Pyricularia pennisetigena]|uniref:hypothetical protein n=1 Tax=Pyricularia pennisetigena TaxID=1578925 RepID=UPI00114E02C2|nr:hypothetical protein PpBr36_03189 [Pyricularia pennisetigena]TLS30879.1 hypothetical protein PpBr36_03189 [Pyricularia pennisetigena]
MQVLNVAAVNHTQWPGSGEMGDPVLDAFYASDVQFVDNATYQQETARDAGAKLLERIGRPAHPGRALAGWDPAARHRRRSLLIL